jgi:hypothetical protein
MRRIFLTRLHDSSAKPAKHSLQATISSVNWPSVMQRESQQIGEARQQYLRIPDFFLNQTNYFGKSAAL